MELFTEIEFKSSELEKVHRVLYTLSNEGWKITNVKEFVVTEPNKKKEIQAVKYFFRREI